MGLRQEKLGFGYYLINEGDLSIMGLKKGSVESLMSVVAMELRGLQDTREFGAIAESVLGIPSTALVVTADIEDVIERIIDCLEEEDDYDKFFGTIGRILSLDPWEVSSKLENNYDV